MVTRTLQTDIEDPARERSPGPGLVRVIDLLRPLDPPAVAGLRGLDRLTVGRSDERGFDTEGRDGLRCGRWGEADPWMSHRHFRVEREDAGWVVSDDGSKNGTRVNGASAAGHRLRDGDVIDAGNSVFLFRDHGPTDDWLDLARETADPAARTLCHLLRADLAILERVAEASVPVLIFGETGSGKEVVARFIHRRSARSGRFVGINCGAIPAGIAEAELFGAVKGAYSGAADGREGHLRASHGGTLFLDEIAELAPAVQTAFLRALQEREVTPVGSSTPCGVDLRLVAATHQRLEERCGAGEFRDDLFARLRGHVIELPPLRERLEDLGILIAALLGRIAGDHAERVRFTDAAVRAMLAHRWPHNVRELAQTLESALAIAGDAPVGSAHLPVNVREGANPATPAGETGRLHELLARHDGNVAAVARALRTSRSQIRRLAKRHAIDLAAYR